MGRRLILVRFCGFDYSTTKFEIRISKGHHLTQNYVCTMTLEIANSLFNQQRYKDALALYDRLLNDDRKNIEAYFMRGLTHHALLDASAALADLSKVIELDNHHHEAFFNRALILAEQGDLTTAKIDVECAMATYGADSYDYLMEGIELSHRLKHYADLKTYAERLAKLEPDLIYATESCAFAYLGLGEYEQALNCFEQVLRVLPQEAAVYNNIGYTYCLMGDYNQAIPYLNTCIKYDPDFAYAYANRGYAKLERGSIDSALKDVKYSLELDPSNGDAYFVRASIHQTLGNNEAAISDFELARTLGYDWPTSEQ